MEDSDEDETDIEDVIELEDSDSTEIDPMEAPNTSVSSESASEINGGTTTITTTTETISESTGTTEIPIARYSAPPVPPWWTISPSRASLLLPVSNTVPLSVSPAPVSTTSTASIIVTSTISVPQAHALPITPKKNSPKDFKSPKKTGVASSATASCADDDEGESCPICFEPWSNSGNHRLASLKCGHLFGQSCIEKWLQGQGGKCPHCNSKAKKSDIRVIYAKTLKTIDTTERDRAIKDLEREREERRKAEIEAAQLRLQHQLAVAECNRLREEVERHKQQAHAVRPLSSSQNLPSSQLSSSQNRPGFFTLQKTIRIWDAGGCRVLAYNANVSTLVVSQPSSSPLFPGFGVKKISTVDLRAQYLTIHGKAIRDLACNCGHPGLVLSCSLDKTVKITSLFSNTVVQSYSTSHPLWSCTWNADDSNYFYAGATNGSVLVFDVRNTSEQLDTLTSTIGDSSPVVALQYIPKNPQATFRPGGLLVGQLHRTSFYEHKSATESRIHILPFDGNLTSLSFEPVTRHILASFRPSAKHSSVRHQMFELAATNPNPSSTDTICTCNLVNTYHGGGTMRLLGKSSIFCQSINSTNDRVLVAAGDEASSSAAIWDSSTGNQIQKLNADGPVVDVCAFPISGKNLATLTDKNLRIYSWNSGS